MRRFFSFGFIKRYLHRQIYATILAALLLVVLVTGVIFANRPNDNQDEKLLGMAAELAFRALPPATAPKAQQQIVISELGKKFDLDITLFGPGGTLIAASGVPSEAPDIHDDEDEKSQTQWSRSRLGPIWTLRLPDDRWFSINLGSRNHRPLTGLLALLCGIALSIGLASYPFVRKLTGRVKQLQGDVERIGTGDLSARAEVKGEDEIATLATSFNRSAEQIEKLVNSQRQLLAHASHELRTPLARVRLGVEMLKERKDARRQTALEQDIAELDQLIDEILLMSRLDTDAKPQMNELVDMLALAAEEASRSTDCHVSGDLGDVRGSSKLLRRALRNLIENGFKHGKAPVEVDIKTTAKNVIVSISDAGEGIPVSERENVFEPFYRAPGKQNVEGYGLGLALVRQIVRGHDGGIEVVSGAARKSTIRLTLPRAS